jgi:hypothetical protein
VSFLYPRTIQIQRVPTSTDINNHDYEGRVPPFTVVASNVQCSIQQTSYTNKPAMGLPQDAASDTIYRIYIPLKGLAKGTIKLRDIVVDDLGVRYEVLTPYWDSLGYNILTRVLTT